jgi:hypothetical protein
VKRDVLGHIPGSKFGVCEVCRGRPAKGLLFCAVCARSWDRDASQNGDTMAAAIRWTARRTWYFAKKRARAAEEDPHGFG